jgi:Predicted membrane protein
MEWYVRVMRKYAVFEGRARRKEFWIFALANFVIGILLSIIGTITSTGDSLRDLYNLAVLIPNLAVGVRRLHDTGRSGWWLLLVLVPIIGAIVLIVFWCTDSEGDNRYGPNPKYAE